MQQIFDPSKWTDWKSYIAFTSSILAAMGVFFGALVPLLDWLDPKKAAIWFLLFGLIFLALFVAVRQKARRLAPPVPTKIFGVKMAAFGVIWAAFPYIVCSSTTFFPATQRTCICAAVPPEVSIQIRKNGPLFEVANLDALTVLLNRTTDLKEAVPVIEHPDEVRRIIAAMRSDTVTPETQEFIKSWGREVDEINTALLRLMADYSSSPLAPSEYSRQFYRRLRYEIAGSESGMVILHGDEAQAALKAMIESGVTYEPLANDAIVEAARKYLSLRVTKLYGHLNNIPQHYASRVDESFLDFVRQIPQQHYKLVKLIGFPKLSGDFIEFECGNPAGPRRTSSYSRFIVPTSEIDSQDATLRMKTGPWPIGEPAQFFSESWWLSNAIWQMLARESKQHLDNLALRISDFNACGPP